MSDQLDRVVLEATWKAVLAPEFESPYMTKLRSFLLQERSSGKTIYPPMRQLFNALDLCRLADVKVVIIGQDPYIAPGQAHGLCFSVPRGVAPPPSLENILKEIREDMADPNVPGGDAQRSIPGRAGCLEGWAEQGVLLLNSTLTVAARRSASHQGMGWERFTDRIVALVNDRCEHVVFLLWGNYAKRKGTYIHTRRHLVLESSHPSPLSAHTGFFGCRHFSKANLYLQKHHKEPIDWFDVR